MFSFYTCKKWCLLALLSFFVLLPQFGFSQGIEDFTNLPLTGSSYQTGEFVGNNSQTWSYINSRGDRSINGKAICFGKTDSSLKGVNISNGIQNFSCKVQKEFTSTNKRQLELFINGVSVGISEEITGLQDFVINDINVDGVFSLELKNISSGGKQVSIDDIEWTAYSSGSELSSAKAITAFAINGMAGTIDESAHTVAILLPAETDVSSLAPVITISDKAAVVPESGVAQDFTNSVDYTVTAEDGSTQAYAISVTVETPVESSLLINELDCDQTSTDTKEFLELYDGGTGNIALDDYVLVFYNGSNDLSYATYDLTGQSTNNNGFFVIGSSEVTNVNLSPSGFSIQNGADAVALYKAAAADFPNSTALTTENLVDFVVYDTNDGDDAGLLALLLGGGQINENEAGDKDNHSIYRTTDGEGGARNTSAFMAGVPTPGLSNSAVSNDISVQLALSANSGSEADQTSITLTANLSEVSGENQTVDLSISGTGITAEDYTLSASQLTITAGETSATATLGILDDSENEGAETLTVSLTNPSAGILLGSTFSGDISISDNDNLSNDGSEANPFTVLEALSLAESSTEYYAYGYIVSVGNDFEAPFTNGYYITIADSQDETSYDNCLNLKLESGVNRDTWNLKDHPENLGKQIKFNGFRDTYSSHASFEGNSVIIQLSEEPSLPTVEFALSTTSASEADQTLITLTANISETTTENQTVNVDVSGTGITAADYTLSLSQITILAGESSATASLSILDDSEDEGTESLTVSISNPSAGIQLGTTVSGSISIIDNDASGGSILANYVYLDPATEGDGSIVVNLTPKEYVVTVSPSHHMNSVKVPEDYYGDAVGLVGSTLRDKIHLIIETGAQAKDYGTVWDMCEEGDENPKNADQVWQMYVEQGIAKTAHVSGSSGWNREHTWAKSHGGFGTSTGPGTDGHHLRATDAQANSARGSRDFGNDAPGYTPPKSARGDVARMIFYMATRWEMTVDDLCKETESSPRHGKLSHLLEWHEEDPVDPYEVRRNNVIYTYQNNRNPFIDHPELVQYIFGEAKAIAWDGGVGTEPSKIQIAGSLADFGMVKFGEESSVQSFTVSATELTENLTITTPQHFLISNDASTYSSSVSLPINSGSVAETTISVKFVPESALASQVTGNIQLACCTESKSISVSGTEGDPALVPLAFLNEDFESTTHNNWLYKSEVGDRIWELKEYGGNKYIQMSAYQATGDVTSWLITPALDMDAYNNENLTFKTKNGYYQGTTLEVLVSTDFDGSDVSTATWQALPATIDERNNFSFGSDYVLSGDVDLSAFEGLAYVAFKYSGNGSSETTTYQVDDVVVEGVKVPITGTLAATSSSMEFPFTEEDALSETKTYDLSFDQLEGDISITASDNYEISLDDTTWSSDLSIAKTEVSPVTVSVRFAPKQAVISGTEGSISHRAKAAETVSITLSSLASSEIADASTLERDKTLDIVSWNIEWFGAPSKSNHASSFNEQLTAASEKIIALDADVYAIQELVSDDLNGDFLQPLIDKLNELAGEDMYTGILGERYSHDDEAPSTEYPAQRVCYIYNKTTVVNLTDFSMFSDLYQGSSTTSIDGYTGDASRFWASGRLPYMFEAEISIDGKKEIVNFVNIHAKCCQDSHGRKLADAKFLFDKLNANYSDDNLVIIGDYNDYLEGSMTSGKASPYSSWFETNEYFDHVVTSTTNIDHIAISNELYDEYQVLTNNTGQENVNISDHHPILLRLKLRSEDLSLKEQSISFDAIADKNYGDAPLVLNATASSGLAVSYELVSGPANLIENELSLTGIGTVTIKATQKGNDEYEPAVPALQSFDVQKGDQAISFTALEDKTYGDPAFEITANASSGLDVIIELISGPASLSGNELSITGVGVVIVKTSQEGNENYNAAEEVNQSFEVIKASQEITFTDIEDRTYQSETIDLSASSTSNLPVIVELISGPASLTGSSLSVNGAGEISVKAIQLGDDNYEAAEAIVQSFLVKKASQLITFNDLPDNLEINGIYELTASSDAATVLEVEFRLISGFATLNGNSLQINGSGEIIIEAYQDGNENYLAATPVQKMISVSKTPQNIEFTDIPNKTYGDPAFLLSANASSGLDVSFDVVSGPATISGNEVSITGTGTVIIKATQMGNDNYEAAESITKSFTVSKANQTIDFAEIDNRTYGDPAFLLSANASSGLDVSFDVVSGPATISGNEVSITGTGTVIIKATQTGNDNYEAAETTNSFEVFKANQYITFDPIEGVVVVDEELVLIASSDQDLPIEFEILEGEGEIVGSILTPRIIGTFKIRAYHEGTDNYYPAEAYQSFNVSQATGIKDVIEKAIKMYPNPTRDFVSIDLPNMNVKQISILDSRGQLVRYIDPNSRHRINVQDLNSGVYFISIRTDEVVVTKRLMIVR